jgi:hypothetical protein
MTKNLLKLQEKQMSARTTELLIRILPKEAKYLSKLTNKVRIVARYLGF